MGQIMYIPGTIARPNIRPSSSCCCGWGWLPLVASSPSGESLKFLDWNHSTFLFHNIVLYCEYNPYIKVTGCIHLFAFGDFANRWTDLVILFIIASICFYLYVEITPARKISPRLKENYQRTRASDSRHLPALTHGSRFMFDIWFIE